MGGPLRIGIVGTGNISRQYLDHLARYPDVEVVAVADLSDGLARSVAAERGVHAMTVDELLVDDRVDLVLNLTIPAAHAEIDLRAIAAGKHVYSEKPLALDVAQGRRVLEAATAAGVMIGCAPDTVLGSGVQTARQLLDAGSIGAPVGASIHWSSPGHERWHPAPAFYYQPGAGPLFDMGPYYLSALVTLLGPVARVSGSATRSSRSRYIATGPREGTTIAVDVDTHVVATLETVSGLSVSATVSFEVWATRSPLFEIYATAGTLSVPDPNLFDGDVEVCMAGQDAWQSSPSTAGHLNGGRGLGIADLAQAIAAGGRPRASGELALHVLEIMEAVLHSAHDGTRRELTTRPERPAAVPLQPERP